MKVYETFKCTKCGCVKELNNLEYIKCDNNCYRIKLHNNKYGGYNYDTSNGMDCFVKSLKNRRSYIEDKDIIIPFTEEIETLINEIKAFNDGRDSWNRPFDLYEYNISDSTGIEKLQSIKFEISKFNENNEMTEIVLSIRFIDTSSSYSKKGREDLIESVPKRLRAFKDLVENIINKDLDINDRKYIENNLEYSELASRQQELYDNSYYL